MIVLDANVIIAFFDPDDAHHHRAFRLLDACVADEFSVSALTIAECLVRPAATGDDDRALFEISSMGLQILPLAADTVQRLARVRATSGLRMPDAVVLHAAMESGARLATFDATLAAAAAKVGVETVAA